MKIQRMAEENSTNVALVEPNDININPDIVNGIPQYQDMYIFAELVAESKGRTVIVNGNATSTTSKKINFIGNDQNDDIDNPNYLKFTTNYYDGSNEGKDYYEGFGISDIKILINSSFIPQVDIQFVDIRGLAFFNQDNSPYRVLFDFPPPLFKLTVKGHYGKALTYELHLVSYTSEFSSKNGNFIIDAKFVAVTFAPLTDILFRYVVNAPLIGNDKSMTPNTGERPENTYELILKLKNLYSAIAKKLKTDDENKDLISVRKSLENIEEISDMLKAVIDNQNETLSAPSEKPYLIIKTPKDDFSGINPATRRTENYDIKEAKLLSEFNDIIKSEESSGMGSTLKNRLVIGYRIGTNIPLTENDYKPVREFSYDTPITPFNFPATRNYSSFRKPLLKYREMLLENNLPSFSIDDGDIADPKSFTNAYDIKESKQNETQYYCMDITDYYYKIYKEGVKLDKSKEELSLIMAEKINNMVTQNLGMTPSIYNIFEVILNDVDRFFEIMRETSELADEQHNDSPDNKIIYGDIEGDDAPILKGDNKKIPHIYPYPLIIETSEVYGGTKKERKAPIVLSKTARFPELDLVSDFMDTFLLQNKLAGLYTARDNQNDDGTYKWIPVSPYDSALAGASPASPYLNRNDNVKDESFKIFLKRFYILTQGTIFDSFYNITKTGKDQRSTADDAYVKLFAESEAINMVSALIKPQNAEMMKVMANQYKNNIDEKNGFYDYLKTLTDTYDNGTEIVSNSLYNFPTNDPKYFPITPTNLNDGKVYTNKGNPDFEGLKLDNNSINIQIPLEEKAGSSTNPVDNFNKNSKKDFLKNGIFNGSEAEHFFNFTEENVIFIGDTGNKNDVVIDEISTFTRYLFNNGSNGYLTEEEQPTGYFPDNQKEAYLVGNNSFTRQSSKRDKKLLKFGKNIMDLWSNALYWASSNGDIIDTITGTSTQKLSTVIILSNFGSTVSPFNIYPNQLNGVVFDVPAAIQVPSYYAPYLGALLTAIDDGWVNEILDYFTGETNVNSDTFDNVFENLGYLILADLHDVEYYLSENDKTKFKTAYKTYEGSIHDEIVDGIKDMTDDITENKEKNVLVSYKYYLNQTASELDDITGRGEYFWIIKYLMERDNFINFGQNTFKMSGLTTYNIGYTSLETINETEDYNDINKTFFSAFFSKLASELKEKSDELVDAETALKKAKGDIDIITQLYYSFKNINDKWLTGAPQSIRNYPYNYNRKRLIESFAFVDRAMNPIGETMLNAEILIDMLDDPNLSLFSVLTQLLSLNGFEFFPLQNFMSFDSKGWTDSFKIHTGGLNDTTSPFFVCMYIGGAASYPSISGNGFENDGIIDISKPGVADFSTKKPVNQNTVNDLQEENKDFPWREVRAFKVRFAEQSQSMFTEMKIDSKEYPETNESIQILSRLAGDNNPDAPVPKGQNLYNLYENRSYKATISGFGNMMIQPTQYFQLENVPLFNGAYIILSVEHKISANKMSTSFSGTKLLKYPVPRVLNPVAFTNYDGSAGDIVVSAANFAAIMSSNEKVKYDSMYVNNDNTLKIG